MGNLLKALDSGAQIEVQAASFEKGHRLLQAVRKSSLPTDELVDVILSSEVQPALWDCMAICLYNGAKITRDTFESDTARGDYLIVAKEVLVYNLTPFFKGLALGSSEALQGETGRSQRL